MNEDCFFKGCFFMCLTNQRNSLLLIFEDCIHCVCAYKFYSYLDVGREMCRMRCAFLCLRLLKGAGGRQISCVFLFSIYEE